MWRQSLAQHGGGSFATRFLAAGYDIRTVQQSLGHWDLRTTMTDTHVLNQGGLAVGVRQTRLSAGVGRPAGGAAGGTHIRWRALLDPTPGDLRLGRSQQLAVQGLELSCPGAARR